ncbi:unnamed protein product [Protopolystoma xenopodis]|uniref:Dynein heavy chain C-terminal domain-containing protein n=1 Tax=Protopolystoma xenopodis TaxID=117903 RepID=A0A3S5CNN2_9PLAT|nr:unnamed protein product [Protopolystoma xenopodis]
MVLRMARLTDDAGETSGNNCCLVNQAPQQLFQELPVVRLLPIEQHRLKLTNTVNLPVYTTSRRNNEMDQGLVTSLDMPTVDHSSHWILQGAAVLLNSD